MKKAPWILAGVAIASTLQAEIYRWVDADGRTHFSDRKPAEANVRLVVPETGLPLQRTEPSAESAASDDQPLLGPYRTFRITKPEAGSVLVQQDDSLDVSLGLEPAILEGHELELALDGRPAPVARGSTRVRIEGAGFGSHRLQARIQAPPAGIIAATAVHDVEIRQAAPPGLLP